MTAATATTVAMNGGMKRGGKEARADMPGDRQKSQGKYSPRTLPRNSICRDTEDTVMTGWYIAQSGHGLTHIFPGVPE